MPVTSPISQTVSNALSTAVISDKLFLLQQYSGAAAAYSLRNLSKDTTNVIRVRRSSDNTEQDFTASQITDGTLDGFVGKQNLFTYSEDFSQWDKRSFEVTDTGIQDPFGGSDATEISATGSDPAINLSNISPKQDKVYNFSFWVKCPSGTEPFNLVAERDIYSGDDSTPYSDNDPVWHGDFVATENWQRFDITVKALVPDTQNRLFIGGFNQISSDAVLHIYGAQVTESSEPLPYVKTDGTLLEGHGYVTTWYDQSGNGNDATQTTAASQPKIVSGGVLVTENGKAALDFDGVDDFIDAESISESQPLTYFISSTTDGPNGFYPIVDGIRSDNFRAVYGLFKSVNYMDSGVIQKSSFFVPELSMHTVLFNSPNSSAWINGDKVIDEENSGENPLGNGLRIGADHDLSGSYSDIQTQEIIIYPSDQSANREAIESNINAHYGIF